MKKDEQSAALKEHIQNFWSGHIIEDATWKQGPIFDRVSHFATYRIVPKSAGDAYVYVTTGCSIGQPAGTGLEFFVMSPEATKAHAETLAMVGHYNSFEEHRLSVGSVINIGRPWMSRSSMCHLLASLPYPYGPRLEWAPPEAGEARFLWLLPIHNDEVEFIKNETLESFEAELDARGINILDPNRPSVV